MNVPIIGSIIVLLAYLAGAIPFGFLTGKLLCGVDIRRHGSHNIGATNVARVLGKRLGLLVLLLDALKGFLPVWLLPQVFALLADDGSAIVHVRVACGVATIVGHMFPCWLGFRGGKGVATALGVVAVLSWQATLAAAAVFALVFAASRIVSLSSMLAAVSFAAAHVAHLLLHPQAFGPRAWSLTAFSLAVPALILFRHRANIARLWRGEEGRFGAAETPPADEARNETPV